MLSERQIRRPPVPGRLSGRRPLILGRAAVKPALVYSVAHRHWWLWWPCRECGGVRLPLRGRRRGRAPVYAVHSSHRCPGCETRWHRAGAGAQGAEPAVWYDTLLYDWVVRLSGTAILPLELHWFDVSEAAVYRTAGDLAYLGDEFERRSDDSA